MVIEIIRHPFSVHFKQLNTNKLFYGCDENELYSRLKSVFSLCQHAHLITAKLALNTTRPLGERDCYAVKKETLIELSRHIFLALFPLITDKVQMEKSLVFFRQQQYKYWLEEVLFAMPVQQWLTLSPEALSHWVNNHPHLHLKTWFAQLSKYDETPLPFLTEITPATLSPYFNCEQNDWEKLSAEASSLALYYSDELCRARLSHESYSWPIKRFLAMLTSLALNSTSDFIPPHVQFSFAGGTLAALACSRGWLIHHVYLSNGESRVTQYHVLSPTAWLASERGSLFCGLSDAPECQWRERIALYNPCFPIRIKERGDDL